MKIILPSKGVLGCKSVDLELPRYRHIRDLSQVLHDSDVIGYEFVKSLLDDPKALEQMTYQDKDYLLTIAVSALHMNAINLTVTCSCGQKHSVFYEVEKREVHDLDGDATKPVTKEVLGETYTYHFISAATQNRLCRMARENAKDEAEYRKLYELYFVTATFGYPLTQEGFDHAASLTLLVYYSALLFHEMCFHGVDPFVMTKCPGCGRDIMVAVPLENGLMNWSSADVINEFVQVAKIVGGLNNFLDLSIPELEQIKENMRTAAI